MTLPDNRMRFDTSLIDFNTDVGVTGQDHDSFPGPDQPPRYDWLRIMFISLLANQSSYSEPTQKRDGTLWLDLNNLTIKIWASSDWRSLSEVLSVVEGSTQSDTTTLAEWYTSVQTTLISSAPDATFSGRCTVDGTITIIIPESLRDSIDLDNSRPIVYKNGILIDPRDSEFHTAITIRLRNGTTLDNGDEFTVFIQNISPQLFHVPDVVIP